MRADGFVEFRRFSTIESAQVLKSLLEADGVDCLLDPSEPLAAAVASGGRGITLFVRREQHHRAEFILRDSEFSEQELAELASASSDAAE